MVGYIYLITDTTNGMKYTGKHHYHIEGQLDPNYHGSGVIIKNIYKKRPETLKEEYIKTCYSEEEMCSDEQYYIKLFKTLWPNGYNLTEGGDGGEIPCEEVRKKMSMKLKGRHISEETRRKISNSHKGINIWMKGKTLSEETKKKISESLKGRPSGMLGKKHSDETKKKMSDEHRGEKNPFYGKHHSEENKIKWSEKKKGKHHSEETKKKMSDEHRGEKNPFYGKHHSEEAKKKMSESHKGKTMSEEVKKKLSKKVLQFTLDGEFVREWPSTRECGRNGFDSGAVGKCCQGKLKQYKGFKWCYAEE